jgi:hypothetical protein
MRLINHYTLNRYSATMFWYIESKYSAVGLKFVLCSPDVTKSRMFHTGGNYLDETTVILPWTRPRLTYISSMSSVPLWNFWFVKKRVSKLAAYQTSILVVRLIIIKIKQNSVSDITLLSSSPSRRACTLNSLDLVLLWNVYVQCIQHILWLDVSYLCIRVCVK